MPRIGRIPPAVMHPGAVTDRWQSDPDRGAGERGATAVARGPEHRVAAFTLAALLLIGGALVPVPASDGGRHPSARGL
jgi:hypothetical protein